MISGSRLGRHCERPPRRNVVVVDAGVAGTQAVGANAGVGTNIALYRHAQRGVPRNARLGLSP